MTANVNEYTVCLTEPETMTESEIEDLCSELQELGRTRARGSSHAVDLAEYRAVKLIRCLLRKVKHG